MDLFNFYTLNAALLRTKEYSLSDLENMLPFERDVYVDIRNSLIQKEKQNNNTGSYTPDPNEQDIHV